MSDDEERSVSDRLDDIEKEMGNIKTILEELSYDFNDHKEAFEHTDDSLSNLRVAVSSIKMEDIKNKTP